MRKIGFKLLLIVVIQLLMVHLVHLYAQKIKSEEVPEEVMDAFNSEYVGVKVMSWMLDSKQYVATFKDDGSVGKAVYTADGTWLRTTYDIPKAELPSAIEHFVLTTYGKDYGISLSCLEELPDMPLHYYIEVKMSGVGMEASLLTFDTEGKVLTRKDAESVAINSSAEAKPDKQSSPAADKSAASTKPTAPAKAKQDTKGTTTPTAPVQRTGGTAQNGVYSAKPSTVTTQPVTTKSSTSSAAKPTETPKTTTSSSAKKPAETKPETANTAKMQAQKEENIAKSEAATKEKAEKEATEKAKSEAAAKEKAEKEAAKQAEKERKNAVTDQYGNVALPSGQIPVAVAKALAKKTSSKEELNWFKIDTFYVAKCIVQSRKNEFFFTESGEWVKTLIMLPEEGVTANPSKHLSTFYKGYKFVSAMKEQNPSKNDILMVEIYEKENIKQKLITTVLFDKTGKLIRSIDPNYQLTGEEEESESDKKLEKYYEKMDMSLQEDPSKGIPTNIVNAFKAKYPKITAFTWERDVDGNYVANWFGVKGKEACVIGQSANVLETHMMSNIDNLPMTIQSYIKENYKTYKAVEFYNVKALLEKNSYYKVVVESKKTKSSEVLWFTTTGRFIER
ncbi:MAG: PepSY-like domain-containing protein [Bacteroidales bacterium]|jgi:hypothetical protein|nr:PepSY-like domain-containing protein [Bacteroidales bacterium]